MPLRCLDDVGRSVLAWALSDEAWRELRQANRQRQHLRMPCCDAQVVLRTSTHGLRFFAHKARSGCDWAPESMPHLLAKLAIAKAASAQGWEVSTEYRDRTPEGEVWVADVFAQRGEARLAFEVQWSPQSLEETERRQAKYAASGVRGMWFMRDPPYREESHTLPLVWLQQDDGLPPQVLVRGLARTAEPTATQLYALPLEVFVTRALSGDYVFGPLLGKHVPVRLTGNFRPCQACGTWHRMVTSLRFMFSQVLPGFPTMGAALHDFETDSVLGQAVQAQLTSALCAKYKLGRMGALPYQKPVLWQYCQKCDAMLGRPSPGDKDELFGAIRVRMPARHDIPSERYALRPFMGHLGCWVLVGDSTQLRPVPGYL